MSRRRAPHGLLTLLVLVSTTLLASCDSTSAPRAAPRATTPTDLGGASGVGPLVVDSRSDTASGRHVVTIHDRAVAIERVTTDPGDDDGTVVVSVTVSITGTTPTEIPNQPSFFVLLGRTGDTFAPRNAVTDPFFADIAPQESRRGTLEFGMPRAAATGLALLYRPDDPSDAVLVPLDTR